MHRLFVALLCAAIVSLPIAVEAANFTGSWAVTGTLSTPDAYVTISPVCKFKQDDNRITGSCKGPSYLGSVEGAVDGNTIVWHWYGVATGKDQPPSPTRTFRGKLGSDGLIRGSWIDSVLEDASGVFTAQRIK